MKHDFVKLAMAGLLAGFCVSAAAAPSAKSDKIEQEIAEMAVTQTQAGEEIAMAKCSKEATQQDEGFSNQQSDCSNNDGKCKEQTSASEMHQVQRKSAAQKAMGQ